MTTDAFADVIAAKREAALAGEEYVPPVDEVPEEETEEVEETEETEETEAEEEAEEETEEVEEEVAEDDDVAWVKDRYGEDVSPKIAKAMREKDLMIARQGTQMGELRSKVEAIEEKVNQEPTPQLDKSAWQEWASETVENGGGDQGALEALESGGYDGYAIYLREWMASDDPGQRAEATLFNNMMIVEMAAARTPEPVRHDASPASEARDARELALVRHPDLEQYEDDMNAILDELPAAERQILATQAQTGVEGKAHVLSHLYLTAAARKADTRVQAQVEEAKQRDSASRKAKIKGTVASAEATATRTPLTEAESRIIHAKNARRKEWGLPLLDED